MNIISRVEIKGFWETRDISFELFDDVNFFIGSNGSGKTTVINIVASALLVDFENIVKLPFSSLKVYLREVGGNKGPSIEVSKVFDDRSSVPKICYAIKEKASEAAQVYELDIYEEELLARRGIVSRSSIRNLGGGLAAKISGMVFVSWLSIHRSAGLPNRYKREEAFESSVDQKIDELSVSLAKYFSVLNSKVSEEIAEFQKSMIVSLLTEQTEGAIFKSVRSLDLDAEKRSISDIFAKLSINKSGAKDKLDRHYRDVKAARDVLNSGGGLSISKAMLLVSAHRSHRVIQEWNTLLAKQQEILEPRVTFLNVLNGLYKRKKIDVNQKNELEATTDSGKKMPIRALSSGEKQLLIILGEALLQQKAPYIYVADEPELSLHVNWQDSLIDSLRLLNPNAQIVCATHSPDVVSHYGDRVHNMKEVLG